MRELVLLTKLLLAVVLSIVSHNCALEHSYTTTDSMYCHFSIQLQFLPTEEQSGEVIKSSYLKKHDEPHGIDLERQEKTSDLHKGLIYCEVIEFTRCNYYHYNYIIDLLSLVNEVVTENQSLKTELRRKEGTFETVENS